ncbi:hypothetical protein KR093_010724, partial [Drosophila rubida]
QGSINLETYRSKQQECFKELKIPEAEAKNVSEDKLVVHPSESYKCFHSCLYKKLGLITNDKPNDAAILAFAQSRFSKMPVDAIKAKLKACSAKGPITCEFVLKYETCMAVSMAA